MKIRDLAVAGGVWPFIRSTAILFNRFDCLNYSASLAYTTLLSLVPMVAMSLSVLSSFDVSRTAVMKFFFNWFLPNEELAGVIQKNINIFADNVASVSIFGLITLTVFSLWVVSAMESAFNMIWGVRGNRSVFNQFVAYWSALTFSPVLIAASIIITAQIRSLVLSDAWRDYSYAQGMTLKAIPVILTWTAFFLIYKLIPFTTVNARPAWAGAALAGSLFELAKLGFDYYLRNFANYNEVYGALSVIPIFLLWLYVVWVIVLLGAVITRVAQHGPVNAMAKEEKLRARNTLLLLLETARLFESGGGAMTRKMAKRILGLAPDQFSRLSQELRDMGLAEIVDSGGIMLSRPPERIYMGEVALALSDRVFGGFQGGAGVSGAVEEFIIRAGQAIEQGLSDITLKSLLAWNLEELESGEKPAS
ncbi:MAG: YihY family inner membrane protein [Nitrospinae bacterium]|nr:YihY family inner membrane protein [Nitrospinota bacterium]